jgi:peroxiredoxin
LDSSSVAPDFILDTLDDGKTSLDNLLQRGKNVLLVFSDPNCGPCQQLMPEVAEWRALYSHTLTVVVISEGTKDDNAAKLGAMPRNLVLIQRQREVAEAYGVYGTPAAALVRAGNMMSGGVATGAEAIRNLNDALNNPVVSTESLIVHRRGGIAPVPKLKIGDAAPEVQLVNLDGQSRTISEFFGEEIFLMFWNPACAFCEAMLPTLRDWETDNTDQRVLIVSRGTREDNRAMGLRSPILLDQSFLAGAAFGAAGTPMAVMINSAGEISSELVAGMDAVIELANARRELAV